MRRILLILILVALTAAAGCRMCAHPFDECGPTYVGDCGSVCCNPYARAGSVLSPPLSPMAAPEMVVQTSAEGESVPLEGSSVPAEGSAVPTEGDALLEPIPAGTEVSDTPQAENSRVVRLPAPTAGDKDGGPTFLR